MVTGSDLVESGHAIQIAQRYRKLHPTSQPLFLCVVKPNKVGCQPVSVTQLLVFIRVKQNTSMNSLAVQIRCWRS
jgi:hypothetical protein